MLSEVMGRAEAVLSAPTAQAASDAFFDIMRPLGASYLQSRIYERPTATLTSASHWAAGGFVARIAPPDWVGSDAFNYICFRNNPLLAPIREGRTRYRFSDFAPHADKAFGPYWDALGEARIAEALCATSYGPDGMIASLHLGFERRDFDPAESLAIQVAGLVLTERLMSFAGLQPGGRPALSPRERDAMALVAEGKTDWEISFILGISEATARSHVDRARVKLGAVNRAQAVSHLIQRRLI